MEEEESSDPVQYYTVGQEEVQEEVVETLVSPYYLDGIVASLFEHVKISLVELEAIQILEVLAEIDSELVQNSFVVETRVIQVVPDMEEVLLEEEESLLVDRISLDSTSWC